MTKNEDVKTVVEGTNIEVPFKEISEDFQKKVYLKNPEQFESMAAQSEYYPIRALVATKTTSSKTLKDLVIEELKKNRIGDKQVVYNVFSNANFKLDDEISKAFLNWKSAILVKQSLCFSATDIWEMLSRIAKDESTSKDTLKRMIIEGYFNSINILESILENPNFKMDDEIRNHIAKTGSEAVKKTVAEKEKKDIDDFYGVEE